MVFSVTMVTIRMALLMNKWTNVLSWMMDEFIFGQNHTSSCQQLVMNIVVEGWNLDKKSLGKWQYLQHCKSIIVQEIYDEWQTMLG